MEIWSRTLLAWSASPRSDCSIERCRCGTLIASLGLRESDHWEKRVTSIRCTKRILGSPPLGLMASRSASRLSLSATGTVRSRGGCSVTGSTVSTTTTTHLYNPVFVTMCRNAIAIFNHAGMPWSLLAIYGTYLISQELHALHGTCFFNCFLIAKADFIKQKRLQD